MDLVEQIAVRVHSRRVVVAGRAAHRSIGRQMESSPNHLVRPSLRAEGWCRKASGARGFPSPLGVVGVFL